MTEKRWLKSTYSNYNGDCVEVTATLDEIRDSKDASGPTLKFNAAALAVFVHAIKNGRFDR